MTLRKDIPPTVRNTVSTLPQRPEYKQPSVGARLFVLLVELPPMAFVALTGRAPLWARIWLATFLLLWLVVTTVQAAKAQVPGHE